MNELIHPFVFMLEDDCDRIARFIRVLRNSSRRLELLHWRAAKDFINHYQLLPVAPLLIALDHDLFTDDPKDPTQETGATWQRI